MCGLLRSLAGWSVLFCDDFLLLVGDLLLANITSLLLIFVSLHLFCSLFLIAALLSCLDGWDWCNVFLALQLILSSSVGLEMP